MTAQRCNRRGRSRARGRRWREGRRHLRLWRRRKLGRRTAVEASVTSTRNATAASRGSSAVRMLRTATIARCTLCAVPVSAMLVAAVRVVSLSGGGSAWCTAAARSAGFSAAFAATAALLTGRRRRVAVRRVLREHGSGRQGRKRGSRQTGMEDLLLQGRSRRRWIRWRDRVEYLRLLGGRTGSRAPASTTCSGDPLSAQTFLTRTVRSCNALSFECAFACCC